MSNIQSAISKFCGITVATIGFSLITTNVNALDLVGTSGQFNNGLSEIRWGEDVGYGQSGLRFTGVGEMSPLPTDTPFALGTLQHFNNPITAGTGLSSANLAIALDFDVITPVFNVAFQINETPNDPLNNCCADIITWNDLFFDGTFFDDNGSEYNFELLGFDGGLTEFISQEGGTSSAELYGQITKVPPVPTPAVILPTVMGLFGAASRRKNQTEDTENDK